MPEPMCVRHPDQFCECGTLPVGQHAPEVTVSLARLTESMTQREVARASKFPYRELYHDLKDLEEDARLLFAELQKART